MRKESSSSNTTLPFLGLRYARPGARVREAGRVIFRLMNLWVKEGSGVSCVTLDDIGKELRALEVREGGVLLVHSSLSSFGHVEGGADAVIDALLDVVGSDGTVVVPTLTGSPDYSPQCPPHFDVRKTPSWTGRIPETFRLRSNAYRSLHPTHSVACIGPHTDALTCDHEASRTPCGPESPYVRLAQVGGQILFLGVTLDSNTTFHAAEELAQVPYHLQPEPVVATVIGYEGEVRQHSILIHAYGTPRNFRSFEPLFAKQGVLRLGRIGGATVRLVEAGPMMDMTLPLLEKDPWILSKGWSPATAG